MTKEFGRNRRVADLIQRELAMLMERERDGSLADMITISNVDVSPDLKNAKIFVTCLSETKSDNDVIKALTENVPAYRHHMSKALKLRGVPKLKFAYDHNLERANRVTALIDDLKKEDASAFTDSDTDDN